MTHHAFYAPDPRAGWKRLLTRLWPRQRFETPESIDGFAPGYSVVQTVVHVSWRDRLRVLVSGRCDVEAHVYTETTLRRVYALGNFTVRPPAFLER